MGRFLILGMFSRLWSFCPQLPKRDSVQAIAWRSLNTSRWMYNPVS